MRKELRGSPVLRVPTVKTTRQPQWWVGAVTLFAIVMVGTVVALCVDAGLVHTQYTEPRTLYYLFLAMGIVGMIIGSLLESNGHGPTFHPLHHSSEVVCIVVNAVVFSFLLLLWVMYHGDERLAIERKNWSSE